MGVARDFRTDFQVLESFLLLLGENVEDTCSLAQLSLGGLDVSPDVGRTPAGEVEFGQYLEVRLSEKK